MMPAPSDAIRELIAETMSISIEAGIEFTNSWRWRDGPRCFDCGADNPYRLQSRPRVFRCRICHRDFSALSGTPLSHSKVPIQIYVAAIKALEAGGVNSVQFGKMVGIQQRSAWKILNCIKGMTAGRSHDVPPTR